MANIESWGVTDKGYYCPTFDDIIAEKNKKAKTLFGQDFDTDEKSFAGKLFQINAAAELKLCQIGEDIYYSIFPNTAKGLSLDRVCEFVNLQREGGGSAVHRLKVYGEEDYVIPAGTLFKDSKTSMEFYSLHRVAINNEEAAQEEGVFTYYANVEVQCVQSGESGNTTNIDSLVEVDTHIYSVTYDAQLSYGTPLETDPELREKFSKVINGLGTSNDAAIKANVLRVSGVNDVIIIDNNTDENIVISDDLTITNGSYAIIVHSDGMTEQNDNDIAQAIFEKQPFGITQCGNKSVIVKDDSGTEHTVKFTYVAITTINVSITIKKDNTFTSDGEQAIRDNVTKYINGLGIGDEVVYSRLYDYIYNVTGVHKVTDITLNDGKTDIEIPKINIAKVGSIDVTIEG